MHRLITLSCAMILGLSGCLAPAPASAPETAAPEGYARFFNGTSHGFRYVNAAVGEPARRGNRAERFELRNGDCGGSDCSNPRYRSEIRMLDRTIQARPGQDIWYGWSFYNATIPAFDRADSLRLVLGQWTMSGAKPGVRLIQLGRDEGNFDTCSPAICTGPELKSGDVVIQLADLSDTLGWGNRQNNGYICRLFDSQSGRNRWTDITMNTNFSAGLDGYLRVWVNGALKCDYSGPVISQQSLLQRDRPEHRRGVFSSFTERWTNTHGAKPFPTLIAYYDEFRVGASRDAVDVRLREAAGLAPVD